MGSKHNTISQIEEALTKAYGMQTYAAEMLGITYQALWDRIRKSERLQNYIKKIEEKCIDMSEVALMKNIKAGKEASIFFHLKCKGKGRGYIEKVALDHSGEIKGGGTTVNIIPQKTIVFKDSKPDHENKDITRTRGVHAGQGASCN